MTMWRMVRGGALALAALFPLIAAVGCCCSSFNQGVQQGLQKAADEAKKDGDLMQIGLAYNSHFTTKNKGPANVEEFKPSLANEELYQAIKSGKYVVIWSVSVTDVATKQGGTGNVILAYESSAPTSGGAVAMVDGSTKRMTSTEFNAAKKAQPKVGG